MNIAILEILIIIALAIIFFLLLRKLPRAKELFKKRSSGSVTISPKSKINQEAKKNQIQKSLDEIKKLIENNQLDKAERILLKIVVDEPHNGEIYNELGLVYLKQENFKDASSAFLEALKYKKDLSGNLYNNLGLTYFSLKEYPKSIQYYKKAIMLDSEATTRYINLALSQKAHGRPQDALRTLKRAQKIDPENPDIKKLLSSKVG